MHARRWKANGLRSAFTLIELMASIAIIGILAALILPAVQAAREAARRSACANNLRQMSIALQLYHNTYDTFPPGGVEWRPANDPSKRQLAWSVFILPFLEQRAVYAQLDLSTPFDSAKNAAGAATILEVYLCPSTQRVIKTVDGRGACDYGGIFGERITSPNEPPKGTMLYDEAINIPMIRDGTSTTLIVSEDSGFADGQWINGRNVFDQAFAINKAPTFENDIRSEHPGGALAAFCDGGARFLHESMDLRILAALCTRDGGEVVRGF